MIDLDSIPSHVKQILLISWYSVAARRLAVKKKTAMRV